MSIQDLILNRLPSYLDLVDDYVDEGCPQLIFTPSVPSGNYSEHPLKDIQSRLGPALKKVGYELFDREQDTYSGGYLGYSLEIEDSEDSDLPQEIVVSVGVCVFPNGGQGSFCVQVHLGYY